MAISALDSAIFADMFGTAAMRDVFGDDAFLARCVEVEAALARGVPFIELARALRHGSGSSPPKRRMRSRMPPTLWSEVAKRSTLRA